jgi:hypothetical protein
MNTDQICKTCRYYHPYEGNAIERTEDYQAGDCRRYPPYVFLDSGDEPVSAWPTMSDDDDCGEWAAVRWTNPFAVQNNPDWP